MAMLFPPAQLVTCLSALAIFAIAGVTQITAHGALSCNHLKREFLAAENKKLRGVAYRQTAKQSQVLCVRDCHADLDCSSVNYHRITQICDLNRGSKEQYHDNLITLYDSLYFDDDVDTPLDSTGRYSSCEELLEAEHLDSSIYTIFPAAYPAGLSVYCEGGWMVIQRRQDDSVDFYRDWSDYEVGFGELTGDFWIGNYILRNLTESAGTWQLRIDLEDWDSVRIHTEYGEFGIYGDRYQLMVGSYNDSSSAGDSLTAKHNGKPFSTKDKDNDNWAEDSCAVQGQGGWWYDWCSASNLNGKYYDRLSSQVDSIRWKTWKHPLSVKKCSMKIRPLL